MLVKQLQLGTPLLYAFNVKNTPHLIKDIADIPYNSKLRLASFDIVNMYTTIPTNELLSIIEMTCRNSYVEENTKLDLIKITTTLLEQNYFRFKNMTYLQPEGLAMGAPTSSILAEFYLQHLVYHKIYNLLLSHKVEGYFR